MVNRALADDRLVVCPDCDPLQRLPEVEPGGIARCRRRDHGPWRHVDDSLDRCVALALAAAVLRGASRSGRSIAREPFAGKAIDTVAPALSRALATVSADIANAIRELEATPRRG